MQERTQFFATLGIVLLLLAGCVGLYSFNLELLRCGKLGTAEEREFNAVIGRYFKFDSVIVGTSMSENFKCSEFDKITGGYSQKMTTSGGHIDEIIFTTEYAIKHQKIKTVLMDVYINSFNVTESKFKFPFSSYSDEDKIGDELQKAFSVNSIFSHMKSLLKQKKFDRDKNYSWFESNPCGLKHLTRYLFQQESSMKTNVTRINDSNMDLVDDNIAKLVSFIQKHNDVAFYIYLPPHNMLVFDMCFDVFVVFRKKIMDALLPLKNVKLFDFQSKKIVIANFNNYKDLFHYSEKISTWVLEQMELNKHLISSENRKTFESEFESSIRSFELKKEMKKLHDHYVAARKTKQKNFR